MGITSTHNLTMLALTTVLSATSFFLGIVASSSNSGVKSGGGSRSVMEGFKPSGDRLVVIHAEWCGFCKTLLKRGGIWEQAVRLLPGVKAESIDEASDPSVVQSLGVTSFPDIRVLDSSGKSIARFDGERTAQGIVDFALAHIKSE